MKIAGRIVALLLVALGGLWLLQGLGLVHIKPILCFANCTPVEGPALSWTIAGLVTLAIGVMLLRARR
jgi:hypothetical protein